MANRNFQLNEQEKQDLMNQFINCKTGQTKTRLQAVRLYGSGYLVKEIMEITGVSRRSLLRWTNKYEHDGIESLVDQRKGGNHASLTKEQVADLKKRLHQYRPKEVLGEENVATADGLHWTVADLKIALKKWHDVSYKTNKSYHELFASCGFSFQRTAKRYRSRREDQVLAFEEQLEKN